MLSSLSSTENRKTVLIVAGGGGGGTIKYSSYAGGAGGGTNGDSGQGGAKGGNQNSGGTNYKYYVENDSYNTTFINSSFGQGGGYSSGNYMDGWFATCSGGGGWFGGGASLTRGQYAARGGGGGSGYIGGVTSGSMSNGQRSGNGVAYITLTAIGN